MFFLASNDITFKCVTHFLITELFLLCIIINISGIIYLLFVLKEVKRDKKDHDGVDNPAFEKGKRDTIDGHNSNGRQTFEIDEAQKPRSCLADFFNPIVAVECFRLIARKRMFSARNIVLFILVLYFICVAPIYGRIYQRFACILCFVHHICFG